jgi:hypothetical protein
MQKSSAVGVGLLIVIVAVLLIWVRSVSEPRDNIARVWNETDVACLPFGHQSLAEHYHPHLAITVDGTPEEVPANVGISEDCMSELHTHDTSGEIHIETAVRGKTFTLLDYFDVRGESIERAGYHYHTYVDGQLVDPATYVLEDLDSIELQYVAN